METGKPITKSEEEMVRNKVNNTLGQWFSMNSVKSTADSGGLRDDS